MINISAAGYRGYVAEPTKGYIRHRKIYMDIKEPITDFKELKKVAVLIFSQKCIDTLIEKVCYILYCIHFF